MKKWSEIRQAIINKAFMDETEVNSENEKYADKFAYFANECLINIANGIKPRIAVFDVVVYKPNQVDVITGKKFRHDSELGLVLYDANGVGAEHTPTSATIYKDGTKSYGFADDKLVVASTESKPIELPEDFLSFADMVNYVDGEPDPTIVYLGDKYIMLPKTGHYRIFYNALWEPITEDYMNDQEQLDLPIDQSVLNCIPSYVAAQILAEDDVQRSTILKNEYELMLSRLDTNIMYQENHYKSTGGWY
jgi:hypothetical protein